MLLAFDFLIERDSTCMQRYSQCSCGLSPWWVLKVVQKGYISPPLTGLQAEPKQLDMGDKETALKMFIRDGWLISNPDSRAHYSLGVSPLPLL